MSLVSPNAHPVRPDATVSLAARPLVLFDFDDVLADYDHGMRVAVLAERSGTDADAVEAALFGSGLESEADLGLWQPVAYAAELSRRLGAPLTLADCVAARAAGSTANGAVLAIAQQASLRAHVAILTNNGPFLIRHLEQICPALLPLFAGRVFGASDFGVAKPDPAVFEACLARLDIAPSAAVFIDDRQANVDGARAAGLDAHLFTDADALQRALAERHLLGSPHHAP